MTREELSLWVMLGARLKEACPEKYDEIVAALEDTVEAQEVIHAFDWQLMWRSRPTKRYEA